MDEIVDALLVEHFGAGVEQRTWGRPGGVLPLDGGALAGIARILPVDVEVIIANQAHRDQCLLAGTDIRRQVDEVDLSVGRGVGERC